MKPRYGVFYLGAQGSGLRHFQLEGNGAGYFLVKRSNEPASRANFCRKNFELRLRTEAMSPVRTQYIFIVRKSCLFFCYTTYMPDVLFDEEAISSYRRTPPPTSSGLMSFVQKTGLAKNPTEAAYVLAGVVGLSFVLIMVIAFSVPEGAPKLGPDDIKRIDALQKGSR